MKHGVMKKFFVSLGLAAAGTASLHAAYAPDSSDNSKDVEPVGDLARVLR